MVKITHDYPSERYRGREGSGDMESQGEKERVREGERKCGQATKSLSM